MIDRIATALSRRKVLMGLAASATAAASTAEAAPAPQENPALLALADQLPEVLTEYRDARRTVRAIYQEWSPQWPVPEESLIRYGYGTREYRDILGRGLEMHHGKALLMAPSLGTQEVFTAEALRADALVAKCAATKSKRGMRMNAQWAERSRSLVEPARAFWAEVDRITEASAIKMAQAREASAKQSLHKHVDQTMKAEDWTIAGTVIKAQALKAWSEVDDFSRAFNIEGLAWPTLLAASILKHSQTNT